MKNYQELIKKEEKEKMQYNQHNIDMLNLRKQAFKQLSEIFSQKYKF